MAGRRIVPYLSTAALVACYRAEGGASSEEGKNRMDGISRSDRVATDIRRLLRWAAPALIAALLLTAWAPPPAAGSPPPASSTVPSGAALAGGAASVAALTCVLSPASVVYGTSVTVAGATTPAVAGLQVAIALAGIEVATATTGDDGSYVAKFTPSRGGDVIARLVSEGIVSPAQTLVVQPKVRVTMGTPVPFLTLRYALTVEPAGYGGVITTTMRHHGRRVGTYAERVRDGVATFDLPLSGVGLFSVTSTLPATAELGTVIVQRDVRASARRLAVGSKGRHVRGLLTALQRLKVRVPSVGETLTRDHGDAVVAFQKAYRLPRTYVVDGDDWSVLDSARPVKPRYAVPYDHLEVDKTRQILMMVRGGKLRALIAVSTGATGNTPEGSFRIRQKHPATTSGYGGVLFRTMGFYGNFAIHGYVPVPPYPASHGCIREPMWVADWIYDRTALGERLYVYR